MFFCIFVDFLLLVVVVLVLFTMAPMHSANVLLSVPQVQEGCDILYGEICVLDKLHSGMSYSAVGQEFSLNRSTIYIK